MTLIGDKIATFDSSRQFPIREYMITLTDLRSRYRRSDPPCAISLKFSADSLYGFLGYCHSCIHSSKYEMAIAPTERYCLKFSSTVFISGGLSIVYGDKDFFMVSARAQDQDVEKIVLKCLDTLHNAMKNTSLDLIHLMLERMDTDGVIMGKRRYYSPKMNIPVYPK